MSNRGPMGIFEGYGDYDEAEPDEVIWMRDLDSTGSMHPCTPHCSGAIHYIRGDLVLLSEVSDRAALKALGEGE